MGKHRAFVFWRCWFLIFFQKNSDRCKKSLKNKEESHPFGIASKSRIVSLRVYSMVGWKTFEKAWKALRLCVFCVLVSLCAWIFWEPFAKTLHNHCGIVVFCHFFEKSGLSCFCIFAPVEFVGAQRILGCFSLVVFGRWGFYLRRAIDARGIKGRLLKASIRFPRAALRGQ